MRRELTGKWYLVRSFFGFTVMVETVQNVVNEGSNDVLCWEEATDDDCIQLGISIV